jgi:hypothetical protein
VRITRLGYVVLSFFAVCIALAVFASGAVQTAAITIGALVLLLLAGEGVSRGGIGSYRRKQEIYMRDAEIARQRKRR